LASGKLQAANAALQALDRMSALHFLDDEMRVKLRSEYETRVQDEQAQINKLEFDRGAIAAQEAQWARRHLLLAEKNYAIDAFREGTLSQEIYDKVLADIDARLLRIESSDENESNGEPKTSKDDEKRSVSDPNG
jgi:hypothetical protein